MRVVLVGVAALAVAAGVPASSWSATCSDHPNQASAQRAADTRDADGDGVYCESLPCPCSSASGGAPKSKPKPKPRKKARERSCSKPAGVVRLGFSKARYPNIRAHWIDAREEGWPLVLVLNRRGADERRDRLLADSEAMTGQDRDEYPPAIGRGRGPRSLRRGINPVGWMASVAYVPSSENRSHGSSLGNKLRRYCDETRFRYAFR